VCASPFVREAGEEDQNSLQSLVSLVELHNKKNFSPDQPDLPRAPPAATTPHYESIFDAVLDPLFDDSMYMASHKTVPRPPLGDHC